MTEARRKLEWVNRNRRTRVRTSPVAEVLRRVAAGWRSLDPAAVRKINDAFADVDPGFRAHCRWTLSTDGTMIVFVDEASMVGPMRTRWLTKLGPKLTQPRRDARIRKVEFRFGREGYQILE